MKKITSKSHPDNAPAKPITVNEFQNQLPEGLEVSIRAECRSCGCTYPYWGAIEDYNYDMSYCGRSYRCTP